MDRLVPPLTRAVASHPRRRKAALAIAAAATAVAVAAVGVTVARDTPEVTTGQVANPIPSQWSPAPASPQPALTAATLYPESLWDYRFEDDSNGVILDGTLELIDRWDHPDCASAALAEAVKLALDRCHHRVEAAWRGTLGDTWIGEQVLVFAHRDAAAAFYDQLQEAYAADLLRYEDPADVAEASYAARATISRTGGVGRYIVLTVLYQAESIHQPGLEDMAARHRRTTKDVTRWHERETVAG